MTIRGYRRWIGGIAGGLWVLVLVAPLLVPLSTLPGVIFWLLLCAGILTGWSAVLALPQFHWFGLVICAGMLLVPNLWSWPPETLVQARDTLATRLTYLALLTLFTGLCILPVATARFLWRYDQTCMLVLVMQFLVPLAFTGLVWRIGDIALDTPETVYIPELILWITILGGIFTILGIALIMSVVNLVRLLYAELSACGDVPAAVNSVSQGNSGAPQTGHTSVEP
ncbi:MAG: hypothetical protein ACLFVO_16845 [Chloroflexaceae bacterium]|jgi:hypothetical protein